MTRCRREKFRKLLSPSHTKHSALKHTGLPGLLLGNQLATIQPLHRDQLNCEPGHGSRLKATSLGKTRQTPFRENRVWAPGNSSSAALHTADACKQH